MVSPRDGLPVKLLESVVSHFPTAGTFHRATPINTGHINTTYRVETGAGGVISTYVLQKINTDIFRDPAGLMRNIALVTDHIRAKSAHLPPPELDRRVLRLVPTQEGALYHSDPQGGAWRMYVYVADSHPLSDNPTLAEITEAGRGFGRFFASLTDLPAERVIESIPHFHDGPQRFAAFERAVGQDVAGRAAEVAQEIDFIRRHEERLSTPQKWLESGELPLRITHNDTKSNNILLDNTSGESLCVVDLDLVMPGLALYDLGDLVRTSCTGLAEDESEIARIKIDADRLRAAFVGFLEGTDGLLSPHERQSLAWGPCYMALIMATRFLTDYLAGDVYYRVHHPQHNRQRAQAQIALAQELDNRQAEIVHLIDRL